MKRALLAILLMLPIASAAPVTVLTDGSHDTSFGSYGENIERWRPADLLRLDLDERSQDFRFILYTGQSSDPTRVYTDEFYYEIFFRHGTVLYKIEVEERVTLGPIYALSARLYIIETPGSFGTAITGLDTELDGDGGYAIIVPRVLVVDQNHVEPFRGESLRDIFVTSQGYFDLFEAGAMPQDRMPNDGFGAAKILVGVEQIGHARMSADGRIRGSNGEATTFLWSVNLTNAAEYSDTFTLALESPPSSWEVRLPYAKVEVPANSTIQFPVLATIPFAHQHGKIDSFLIEARSLADREAAARIDLGVEYLSPAQPAGHHSTVYLHSKNSDELRLYFGVNAGSTIKSGQNFMSTDPRNQESGDAVAGTIDNCLALRQRTGWVSELEPRLRLGLDFDMDETGTFSAEFTSPFPLSGARIDGRILVADSYGARPFARDYNEAGGTITVATLKGDSEKSLAAGSTTQLTATITPSDEGDFVPFNPGQSMVLVLWLSGEGAPGCIGMNDQPLLEPGASMQLPLLEYHDPIDASFAAPDFIRLASIGPVERLVPAGGSGLWNLTLRNDSPDDRAFEVSLSGINSEWGRLPGGSIFIAPGNGSVSIPIAISPPGNERQGNQADVIVEAVNVKDPRMRGLLRLVATVAGHSDGAIDDTMAIEAIESANKKSPAPWWPAMVLLAFAAWRSQRRNEP